MPVAGANPFTVCFSNPLEISSKVLPLVSGTLKMVKMKKKIRKATKIKKT